MAIEKLTPTLEHEEEIDSEAKMVEIFEYLLSEQERDEDKCQTANITPLS